MTASYIGACLIVGGPAPRRAIWYGFVVGFLIWPTVALLPLLFAATGSVWITLIGPLLPILLWLAYVGMAVPAAVIERLDYRIALARGIELAKVDFVHGHSARWSPSSSRTTSPAESSTCCSTGRRSCSSESPASSPPS